MLKLSIGRLFFSNSVSFIGCGKMGGAILGGMINSGKVTPEHISVCEKDSKLAEQIKQQYGVDSHDVEQSMNRGKYVMLAVKPKSVFSTLNEIKPFFDPNHHVLVSIVAGFSTQTFEEVLPGSKVVRVMPNTPALIN